ncbi:MAG: hypothetical protein ACR2NP_17655 [Pirellulaceae bacterium]
MNRLLLAASLIMALFMSADVTSGQTVTMDRLYGQGVHAYHAGQLQQSMTLFSEAINQGSRDPRVYYFRGLVLAAFGDTGAASGDFQMGARFEATSAGRYYAVGRSLERVQGPLRMQIEEARRDAKLFAQLQQQAGAPGAPGSPAQAQTLPFIPSTPALDRSTQMNFPDVTGIENPGTPFSGDPPVNTPQPAVPQPAEPQPEAAPMDAFDSDEKADVEPKSDPFGDPVPAAEETPDANDPTAPEGPDDPFGDTKPAENETPPAPAPEGGGEGSEGSGGPPDDPFGDDDDG